MSDLRQDIVSGDWIIIAPKRADRPNALAKRKERTITPVSECPFEDLATSGNEPAIITVHDFVDVIPNKYPILVRSDHCTTIGPTGPYASGEGIGYHDVVITRDHMRNFPKLSTEEACSVFDAFRERLLMVEKDPCASYASVFHAWGPTSGATVYHPHYQILTLPIVPPDVNRSLEGSLRYWDTNKKCVHCVIIDYERIEKKRIIYENDDAVVIAPFASRQPFEVRVFPKKHVPVFQASEEGTLRGVVQALQTVLRATEIALDDPDYNFFIHTAPLHNQEQYDSYHWHIEVLPKTSLIGGFEWSTGIDVNIVDPDYAAETLRTHISS